MFHKRAIFLFYNLFFPLFFSSFTTLGGARAKTQLTNPLEGRFVGTVKMPDGLLQIATADFVVIENSKSRLRYAAFIKLIFGEQSSHEYVTYRFPEVDFERATGRATAELTDQDLTIDEIAVGPDQDQLKIKARVLVADNQSLTFNLSKSGKYHDEGFLRSKISGIYESTCGDKKNPDILSLLTARSFNEISLAWNPFAGYQINGSFASWRPDFRYSGASFRYQSAYSVSSGIYDFFSGELQLMGSQFSQCKVTHEGLLCNRCLFRSIYGPPMHTDEVHWEKLTRNNAKSVVSIKMNELQENKSTPFKGYVHHAATNTYQGIEIFLDPKKSVDDQSLKISGQVILKFLRRDQEPIRLEFRFEPRNIADPMTSGISLLSVPKAFWPADPMLRITHIDENTVRGEWYSWFFGYVGEFSAAKDRELTPDEKKINWLYALDGIFDGGVYPAYLARYIVGVQSIPGRFAPKSDSPYFPLTFGGYVMVNSAATVGIHRRFVDGAFDYYTGRFNIGNFFMGDVVFENNRIQIERVDISQASANGFVPGYDSSGSWSWSMPFRVFRSPREYWPQLDGWRP